MNRGTIFFEDNAYGWGENYYDTALGATLVETMNKLISLAKKRSNMLAQGPGTCFGGNCQGPTVSRLRTSVVGGRATLFATPDDVLTQEAPGNPTYIKGGTINLSPKKQGIQTAAPDNPYSAMNLIVQMDNGHQSKRKISGVPDEVICDQSWNTSTAWNSFGKSFLKELVAGNWGGVVPTPGTLVPAQTTTIQQILTLSQDSQGHAVITVGTGFPPNCNARYVVQHYVAVPGTPRINGIQRWFPGTPDPITGLSKQLTSRQTYKQLDAICLGEIFVYVPIVSKFNTATFTQPGLKKRGKPIGGPRGRASRARG